MKQISVFLSYKRHFEEKLPKKAKVALKDNVSFSHNIVLPDRFQCTSSYRSIILVYFGTFWEVTFALKLNNF